MGMKLIDADALRQAILSIMPERSEVLLIVDNQPEVVTGSADGTWIQKADATGHEYSMCSVCETVINTPDGFGGYYKLDMTGAKYCPNCGARMD